MENAKSLSGKVIKETRTDLGWTQRQLAQRVGIDQPRLSRMEKTGRLRYTETVRKIERVLGLPEGGLAQDGG